MLIPTDPARADGFHSNLSGATNEKGNYVVSGAPGEYFVVLWRSGEPLPLLDAAAIRKSAAETPTVTLVSGERKTMDLVK
jgi:hypothetical protein